MASQNVGYIAALDQGTTSTRFMVFDHRGRVVSSAQQEHEQIYPRPGWVEHDPLEIWRRTLEVIDEATRARGLRPKDISCIGITNQRETTVVWDRHTGQPRLLTPSSGKTPASPTPSPIRRTAGRLHPRTVARTAFRRAHRPAPGDLLQRG